MELRKHRTCPVVALANLDAERPLADGRQRHLGGQPLRHAPDEPEAKKARRRQHDGVELALVHLTEPRVDVSADRNEAHVGARLAERHDAPQAARPHPRASGEGRKHTVPRRDEHVTRIAATRQAGEHEPWWEPGRHVLDRVHGEVGAPLEESLLNLLDEEPLAANLRERAVLNPVTRGRDEQLGSGQVVVRG